VRSTAAGEGRRDRGGVHGLRLGELRALRWGDLDFDLRLVHVRRNMARTELTRPKSQTVRSVPMIDQVATTLERFAQRERFTGPEDFVFCNAIGEPLSEKGMRDPFYRALDGAGLARLRRKEDPIVFHDLRHTFGTLAVQVFRCRT